MAYGYPGYPSPPAPPAPPARPSRAPLVLAAAAGALVAAVIAAILVATGAIGDSGSGVGGSSDSVSLPRTVGGYVRYEDAFTNRDGARSKPLIAAQQTSDQKTRQALSAAHDGAGAQVQSYASKDLLTVFRVWVVRAPSPAPVVQVVDANYLGLAAPPQYVAAFGHSHCQITTTPTPAGKTPAADSTFTTLCQRSSGDLTVIVLPGGSSLSNHPQDVAALVDEVWDAVS